MKARITGQTAGHLAQVYAVLMLSEARAVVLSLSRKVTQTEIQVEQNNRFADNL
ncbi:MAG TPA: hypothetical protein V6D43_07515 [Candidatus Sericytochromatia bacterium]